MSTSASLSEVLRRELAGVVQVSEAQVNALEQHYALLLRWNAKLNLTTVVRLPDAAVRHYCESLFLAAHLTAGRVVDVGSGAGFPGLPAAIVRSDCTFDLVESHQRKAVFLREASRGLSNVRVLSSRAEAIEDHYEWLISRAVDPAFVRCLQLAPQFALLLGESDASSFPSARVIPLPWGERRVLVIGG